jgi:aminoglycoside phosphotransferase (APT) family kinase protein
MNYQAKVAEARIMDFVRLHTSIPVPRVYFVFKQDQIVYTVMEFIEGTPLADSYRATSPEELQGIAAQIKDCIRQIRNFNITPSLSLGACDGGPFNNVYFRPLPWNPTPNSICPSHPFDTVKAFNAYWLTRAKLDISLDKSESSPIILTHGDLTGRNILVNGGKMVGILDWETIGWYPAFWETMIVWRDARWSKKWRVALESVFEGRTSVDEKYIQLLDSSFKEPERY